MGRLNPFEEIEDFDAGPPARPARARLAVAASLLGLGLLLAFHFALMASWIRRETRPPAWDQAIHLETSLDSLKAVRGGDYDALLHPVPKPGMPPFPPLYHLSLLYAHSRPDPPRAALWANFGYMALLCLSTWALGLGLAGPWVGLAAAVLISCIPEVQGLYFNQLADLPLTAWVAFAYWMLAASAGFRRAGPSLLFGAACAGGMLTKWSFFSYMLPAALAAWSALGEPRRRSRALAALGLAAALCAPWYLAQLPVLLPRLVDASADNAVAVWRGGAVFAYLLQMIDGFESPLWLLGLAAVGTVWSRPERERRSLALWFLAAYVFWTLVPNRQLRYLLPGLVPVVLLAAATWPRAVMAGLCAYQVFSAANFSQGWVRPISLPIAPPLRIRLLSELLPASQDWRLGEILKAADQMREDEPFANLALVANHPYFNGASFNYEVDRLGIEGVRMRGVNRRLCEFAEFLLVKTGSLGPPEVVNQLPEVQKLVLDPASWFQRGYRERRRWPLPDGTEAVLFQRRKLLQPPVGEQEVEFDYYEEHDFLARGMRVDLGRWDAGRGVYPRVRVRAETVDIRGLNIRGVEAVMEDVAMVPVDTDILRMGKARRRSPRELLMDFRFLKMRRLTLAAGTIDEKSAAEFLEARVPALREARFELDGDVSARAKLGPVPIGAEASAKLGSRELVLRLETVRVAGLPVPGALLGRSASYRLDFAPDPELPFELAVPGLSIAKGRLALGPS